MESLHFCSFYCRLLIRYVTKDFRLLLQLARNCENLGFSLLILEKMPKAPFLKWASRQYLKVAGNCNIFSTFARE